MARVRQRKAVARTIVGREDAGRRRKDVQRRDVALPGKVHRVGNPRVDRRHPLGNRGRDAARAMAPVRRRTAVGTEVADPRRKAARRRGAVLAGAVHPGGIHPRGSPPGAGDPAAMAARLAAGFRHGSHTGADGDPRRRTRRDPRDRPARPGPHPRGRADATVPDVAATGDRLPACLPVPGPRPTAGRGVRRRAGRSSRTEPCRRLQEDSWLGGRRGLEAVEVDT